MLAMIRKPACSIMALTAPVRFRAVASGLMIEKVRSLAIVGSFGNVAGARKAMRAAVGGAYSRHSAKRQGLRRNRPGCTGRCAFSHTTAGPGAPAMNLPGPAHD